MSTPKKRASHEEEEHENHERWLITYADMVTLLMVLFIVMFAMSQVDQKKFMALKEGLASGFNNSKSVLPGSDTLLEEAGTSPISPVAPLHPVEKNSPSTSGAMDSEPSADARKQLAQAEADRLSEVARKIRAALKAKGLEDDVRTSIDERGLVVSLVSRHVTFRANMATLTPRGAAVVDAMAPVLRELHEDIEISGHTNQVPVKPKYFETDWDLSAARAVTVLRRFNELDGLPATRLSAAAYGNTRPLVDPSQPGSQAINKRVDVVVLSPADAQTRELLEQFAQGNADSPDGSGTTQTAAGTTGGPGSTSSADSTDTAAGAVTARAGEKGNRS